MSDEIPDLEQLEADMDALFEGDLEVVCDLENPEACEACD